MCPENMSVLRRTKLHSRSYVGLSEFKTPRLQQLSSSASSRCRLQDFLSMHQMGMTLNHRVRNQEVIEEELMMMMMIVVLH